MLRKAAGLALALVLMLVLASEAQANTKDRIMRVARSYAGTSYHQTEWNCSDYTRAVYGRSVGVWMPDWDDKQRHYGRKVKDLKRGDLVFFKEPGSGNVGAVSHVAVYAGNNYVWQQSSYWGYVTKTYMPYIKGFKPGYTRRIR